MLRKLELGNQAWYAWTIRRIFNASLGWVGRGERLKVGDELSRDGVETSKLEIEGVNQISAVTCEAIKNTMRTHASHLLFLQLTPHINAYRKNS